MVLWLILSLLCLTLCLLISGVYLLDHLARRRDDATRDMLEYQRQQIGLIRGEIAAQTQAFNALYKEPEKLPEYQTGMWLPTDEQNAETERILRKNEDHALYAPDQRPRSSRPSRPSGPISGRKS